MVTLTQSLCRNLIRRSFKVQSSCENAWSIAAIPARRHSISWVSTNRREQDSKCRRVRASIAGGIVVVRRQSYENQLRKRLIRSAMPRRPRVIASKSRRSSLKLTRESPTSKQFDIDMVSRQPHEAAMNQAIEDVLQAFRANVAPVPVEDGVGGVYFFRTKAQRITAVFKPMDEEPFAINNPKNHRRRSSSTLSQAIRNGIAPGSAAIREVVAYLLDHEHRANVPSTVIVNATHPAFDRRSKHSVSSKCGSMQLYVRHECSAEDISESLLSIDQIHAIAILDIRLVNQDRHGGNLLVTRRDGPKTRYVLTPIDHGGCLPRITCMDETQFTWSTWSHADCPFNTEMREYIASLDTWADTQRLINNLPLDHQLELDAWLTLEVGTVLLQVCVLEYNMTAAMIGRLMIRGEIVSDDEQSILERLVHNSLERSTRPHNVVSPLDPTWRLYVHHLLDEFRIELREWIHATKYI